MTPQKASEEGAALSFALWTSLDTVPATPDRGSETVQCPAGQFLRKQVDSLKESEGSVLTVQPVVYEMQSWLGTELRPQPPEPIRDGGKAESNINPPVNADGLVMLS